MSLHLSSSSRRVELVIYGSEFVDAARKADHGNIGVDLRLNMWPWGRSRGYLGGGAIRSRMFDGHRWGASAHGGLNVLLSRARIYGFGEVRFRTVPGSNQFEGRAGFRYSLQRN